VTVLDAPAPAPGAPARDPAAPPRPPLARTARDRVLSGTAAGTAAHLRLAPVLVRGLFVVSAAVGVGVVGYGLLWLLMPTAPAEDAAIPPAADTPVATPRQLVGLGLLGALALLLVSRVLGSEDTVSLLLPLLLVTAGLAMIWRQLDTDRELARDTQRWTLVGGVVLGLGGAILLLATTDQLTNARNGFAATLVILVGTALATAPLWRRLLDQRDSERSALVRSEERAAVAAHLHDSVLQTLALIQRCADQPQQVSRLARGQERELRAWLYEPAVATGGTWAGLVAALVTEVEEQHEVTVASVVVGDAPLDEPLTALGQATREAVVNAARHAGVPSVDLYSEIDATHVTVFVRDRGVGFDPDAVPGDRRGLRDSVVGRLLRWSGNAQVSSTPGEGTEVELTLPRHAS